MRTLRSPRPRSAHVPHLPNRPLAYPSTAGSEDTREGSLGYAIHETSRRKPTRAPNRADDGLPERKNHYRTRHAGLTQRSESIFVRHQV